MAKCANCKNDALYEYKVTLNNSLLYCGKDLPKFLESRKKAMLITTTDAYTKANEEALAVLQIKPSESEPIVEKTPAPKKKTKKKAE